ncbi:MAG: MFS transporter, partial [Patescibacteria group bacterium]|nr:MFS transporter [Patescibacteria group bacterium]
MSEPTTMSMGVRVRLSSMMFLQYMLLPVWWVPLATYLDKPELAGYLPWVMSTMALGCLASPLIGMVADRHFASERVLAALNVLTGILLIVAVQATTGLAVFLCLLAAMLAYMPTWGLTSSIAMSHSPSEKFPQIRVFGSIGWVAAGVFSFVALKAWGLKIDGTPTVFYCGAGVAFLAAVVNLLLPHTPPPAKGQKASVVDVLGLRSFSLFKYRDFTVYVLISILVTVAFSIYWSYLSLFLTDKGFELLTVTQNWGQFAEMFFMLLIPLVIAKVGLKWAMVIGLAAQLVRYGSFLLGEMMGMEVFYFIAILVHGLIFGFFFVGGQIYVDRRAPKEMRAQAQGFMFLMTFGVGLLIGNFLSDWLIKAYTVDDVRQWEPVWMWTTVVSAVVLVLFAALFHS